MTQNLIHASIINHSNQSRFQKHSQTPLKIDSEFVSSIQQNFEPQRAIVDEMIFDVNGTIDSMFLAVNTYNTQLGAVPSTKSNIQRILKKQYPFFQKKISASEGVTEKTRHNTAYLHDGIRSRAGSRTSLIGLTKLELISKALSDQPLDRNQRKKVQSQDLFKKRDVIKKIQIRIDQDDMIKKQEAQERKQKQIAKQNKEINIGQLNLDMIANLRKKYFTELGSVNTDEKYKKIQQLKENYIPQQIEELKKESQLKQKLQLKNELVSKRSHFNAYYQIHALEISMQKLVKEKLWGELSPYSRFKGFKSQENFSLVLSPVKEYINNKGYNNPISSSWKLAQ